MLVIKIILTILYALLTIPWMSCLPSTFQRKEDKDEDEDGDESSVTAAIVILLSIIGGSLALSVTCMFLNDYEEGRQAWFLYILPAFFPLLLQIVYACVTLKTVFLVIVLPILGIMFTGSIIIPVRDYVKPYKSEMLQNVTVTITEKVVPEVKEEKQFLEKEEIQKRFGATSISDTYYSNGYNIYVLKDDAGNLGVAVASTDFVKFIPCKYENTIAGPVRERYKKEEIVNEGIVFDGEVPYAKYAILERPNFWGNPVVKEYLLLNMVEADVQLKSYKKAEKKLPKFAW